MTVKSTVQMIDDIRARYGRLKAIKAVRTFTGLSFKSASAMVDEVHANARWYRRDRKRKPST